MVSRPTKDRCFTRSDTVEVTFEARPVDATQTINYRRDYGKL